MQKQTVYLVRVARGFAYISASDGIPMPFFCSVKAL